jgi:hypothetical protein
MSQIPVDITTATVPSDYCQPLQVAWPFLVSLLQATIAGNNNMYVVSATTPGVDDQDKIWHKLDSDGRYLRTYNYIGGAWVSPHPDFPGKVIMWEGDIGTIDTLDGGEAGTVTETTGPMWERVTEMNGRIPIGPGTLESTRTVDVNENIGSEKVTLLEENIPKNEPTSYTVDEGANRASLGFLADDDRAASANTGDISPFGGDADGNTVAHENMPPVRGIWFLRKTARSHYRG